MPHHYRCPSIPADTTTERKRDEWDAKDEEVKEAARKRYSAHIFEMVRLYKALIRKQENKEGDNGNNSTR